MTTTKLIQYKNGNADITLHSDGTRIIDYQDQLSLDYPLNVDVRLSTKCSFGFNENTGKTICDFCHESARVDGNDGDFDKLYSILSQLPQGTEIAIGINHFSQDTIPFLIKLSQAGYICNITINQGHLFKYRDHLKRLIDQQIVYGIGISYRPDFKHIPKFLLDYPNAVLHVICGIDEFDQVYDLDVKKILVLGEKDVGFNQGNVDTTSDNHIRWYRKILKLINKVPVVSFDNLALEQLNIKRFLTEDQWNVFYQEEHSFYIDSVRGSYARSSRSHDIIHWDDISPQQYFLQHCK